MTDRQSLAMEHFVDQVVNSMSATRSPGWTPRRLSTLRAVPVRSPSGEHGPDAPALTIACRSGPSASGHASVATTVLPPSELVYASVIMLGFQPNQNEDQRTPQAFYQQAGRSVAGIGVAAKWLDIPSGVIARSPVSGRQSYAAA